MRLYPFDKENIMSRNSAVAANVSLTTRAFQTLVDALSRSGLLARDFDYHLLRAAMVRRRIC